MKTHLPPIILSAADHDRLSAIAEPAARRELEAAEALLAELDRAEIVAEESLPDDVVRMGSKVTFCTDGGKAQSVTLVYPADADIDARRISVLTPVGAALVGMKCGARIDWLDTAGRTRSLTVERVG